jgi:hypothetical protein
MNNTQDIQRLALPNPYQYHAPVNSQQTHLILLREALLNQAYAPEAVAVPRELLLHRCTRVSQSSAQWK